MIPPARGEAAPNASLPGVRPRLHRMCSGWVDRFFDRPQFRMIFSVFAVFFTTVAEASSALLGLIEGLADLSASSPTIGAGWMSDRSGRASNWPRRATGFPRWPR